jgi:hypothetical protein
MRERTERRNAMYRVYDKETKSYHRCADGVELQTFLRRYIPSASIGLWLDNLASRIREGLSPSAHFTDRFFITYIS